MINGLRVLGFVTARGGSKGLPGKNLRDLCGKPLIAWSIETALRSETIDELVVSTDSQEIADVSRRYGAEVPFLRPSALATDTATSIGNLPPTWRKPIGQFILATCSAAISRCL